MGTTLTGTTPQDTYDSLIKVTDNGPLSGTAKYLSDGLGNDSALAVSTSTVGIGTNAPTESLQVAGNIRIATENKGLIVDLANRNGLMKYANYTTGLVGKNADTDNSISTWLGRWTGTDIRTPASVIQDLVITNAGNVGIGTSSPVTKLAVSDGTNALQLGHDANGPYISGANNAFTVYKRLSYDATDHVFFSSSAERFRITNNGVTFNGDTAAANALDDYEEGTWTMGVSFGGASVGVTTSSNTGTYTKIGRQVTAVGYIALTSKGSSTGQARVTGLPFTIANGSSFEAAAACRIAQITFADFIQINGNGNATTLDITEVTNAGVITTLNDADFANNSEIFVSITYFV